MKIIFLILLLVAVIPVKGQEINIVNYLKQIESGDREAVSQKLPELKSKNPNDPSVLFLEAILTEDGNKAVTLFENIASKYPKSKYADASVYRISSYYYAVNEQSKALSYFNRLKIDYPASPYIKLAARNFQVKNEEPGVVVENSKTEKKYKYTIQAGAFSSKLNAEALKKDLAESGFVSEIKEKNVAGAIFQIVYVGKFTGEEEARDQLEILNKKFKLNGRVTVINNGK